MASGASHHEQAALAEPPRARPLFSRLGEAVVQAAASAGELLLDEKLRRKAGHLVVSEAGKRITDLRDGVATRAGNLQQGLNRTGPGLYARIQKQYLASRHEASLRARRDTPVDVQVGPFLWEDAPQELRSRLWVALLANPALVSNLIQERALEAELLRSDEAGWQARASPHDGASLASGASTPVGPREQAQAHRLARSSGGSGEAPPVQNGRRDAAAAAAEAAPCPAERGEEGAESLGPSCLEPDAPAAEAVLHSPGCAQQQQRRPEPAPGHDASPPPDSPHGSSSAAAGAPSGEAAEAGPEAEAQAAGAAGAGGQEDAWEIVQDASSLADFRGSRLPAARLQPGERGAAMTFRERLLEAVCAVAWPISTVYPEGCLYDTLCQISIGQEEVEEVIQRDINRTFPEHPQFALGQGQQELFRVLKAYSLHDLQVGYCQGMAFVTGVLLMYVPEEPAFRLLARLMDEGGANLRQLYLPGLEGLKAYLRMFEWLLDAALPQLRAHLEAHGVVPVLYASQWFLTAFSCPFPPAFACRVVDVMLTERCGHVMLRVGVAVMRACEGALLALADFEDLVTHLKVEPVRWSQARTRAVLNEAIEGEVSEAALAQAAAAVAGGYDGSLSRRPSTVGKDAPAAASPAQRQGSSPGPPGSEPQAPEPTPRSSGGADGGSPAAGEAGDGIDSAELRLALDALWVGEDGEAGDAAL